MDAAAAEAALLDPTWAERYEGAQQGSAQWLYDRVGHCTGSRFGDVVKKLKSGKPSKERENYMMELVVERITGQPSDHWTSAAMLWGTEQEQMSRMSYEAATGAMVERCGFIKHPKIKWVGVSPDGLVDEDGGFESKSPFNSVNHLYTVLDGMPDEHLAQCQGGMWVTGRKWWDFQSFDPRLPAHVGRYIQRIERDDAYIAMLEAEVIAFIAEVEAVVEKLAA